MSKAWYFFMGDNNDDVTDPELYYKVNDFYCLCGTQICVIYATDNGENPLNPLSPNMLKYIRDAVATGQMQPTKPYNTKKYLYLRTPSTVTFIK